MTCESAKDSLTLLIYDELAPETRSAVEEHLSLCDDCRAEYDREVRFLELLNRQRVEVLPAQLAECRLELSARLAALGPRAGLGERVRAWWGRAFVLPAPARLVRPALLAGVVAGAFFVGRAMQPGGQAAGTAQLTADSIRSLNTSASLPYRIREIEAGPDGRVSVRLEETREVVLAGRIEEEPIQRALLAAVESAPDPGLRLESLSMLRMRQNTPAVREVLVHALTSDPNPGVRLKALEGLEPHASHPAVRSALERVLLADDNPGLRIRAIDLLVASRDFAIAPVLQEVLETEENSYVRFKCRNALLDLNASAESF
jgi:hypothetical protein